MELLGRKILVVFLCFMLLFSVFSSASASASASASPAKIVSGVLSSSVAKLMKWVWSLKSTTKTAISGRSMMKYESGYNVETVFDGSKLGIEPYSVQLLPTGDLLILDSANSNLYTISSSLSLYSRPKLVAGSAEGYLGHVDGKHREAKMNHPKGVAVDDKGNIYVADTVNMAIRKISDAGVTTIAGGKWSQRGGGHVDGPSEEAKFSSDFDVVYVGSSCSLLVIDRGNRAIREIQLHFDDCAYQYESGLPLGIVVLLAAGFFGYMLALLQRRTTEITTPNPYQKPLKSVRPPLIPTEKESEKQVESFFGSLRKLLTTAATSGMEIVTTIFPVFKRKPVPYQYLNQGSYQQHTGWQSQESFEIPKEEEPPSIETRAPTPKKTYAFMCKDADKMQQLRQSRVLYTEFQQQQQKQQNRHQHHSAIPHTYYEQICEKTNEIVFGAVQNVGQRESVIRPTPYAMDSSIRYRNGYTHSFPSYT
ncbi:uncharacterized protein LOC141623705 isoform X2 [Silene latifolia]|uniref:uncharacterized protein LOC141623705 isoform X2 n=1 Tax=Silene latifolia TaxID=37657 RepID=UPI003D7738CE